MQFHVIIPPEIYFHADMVLRQFPLVSPLPEHREWAALTEVTWTTQRTSMTHTLELYSPFKPGSLQLVQRLPKMQFL